VWEQFARWADEDAANPGVYDRVALLDGELESWVFADWDGARLIERRPNARRPRAALRGLRLAVPIAALFALVALLWQPWAGQPGPGFAVATAQGEHRTVRLADGSTIVLNANSRLWLAGMDRREAELLGGEALFDIRHNASDPFVVKLGDDRVEDLGTTFNVVRDGQRAKVEVAAGAVSYRRGGSGLRLNAGQTLDISADGDAIVGRKAPAAIASWRSGQLVFESVPVAEVAADLGRNLGTRISVSPGLALRPFTGSINIRAEPAQVVAQFASTVSGHARKAGGGWVIDEHGDPGR
jgi:transmembrane sensor